MKNIRDKISVMEDKIPDAMTGTYPLSLEDLVQNINRQKEKSTGTGRRNQTAGNQMESGFHICSGLGKSPQSNSRMAGHLLKCGHTHQTGIGG